MYSSMFVGRAAMIGCTILAAEEFFQVIESLWTLQVRIGGVGLLWDEKLGRVRHGVEAISHIDKSVYDCY